MRTKVQYRSREADGSPNPTDIVVGQRLRQRRTMLGWSQEQVGDAVGLTFQQVQKYERAINRIGASRLYELGLALGVPVSYFFEGAPSDSKTKIQGFAEDAGVFHHESTVDKRDALEILRLYNAVPAGPSRRKVLSIVRTVAGAVGDVGPGRAGRPKGSKNKKVVKFKGKPVAKKTVGKRGPGRPRKTNKLA